MAFGSLGCSVSPPYVGNAYCIRDIDANLWPKGCRVEFQPGDALDLFVRAFHHFEKGRINRRSMLVNLYMVYRSRRAPPALRSAHPESNGVEPRHVYLR